MSVRLPANAFDRANQLYDKYLAERDVRRELIQLIRDQYPCNVFSAPGPLPLQCKRNCSSNVQASLQKIQKKTGLMFRRAQIDYKNRSVVWDDRALPLNVDMVDLFPGPGARTEGLTPSRRTESQFRKRGRSFGSLPSLGLGLASSTSSGSLGSLGSGFASSGLAQDETEWRYIQPEFKNLVGWTDRKLASLMCDLSSGKIQPPYHVVLHLERSLPFAQSQMGRVEYRGEVVLPFATYEKRGQYPQVRSDTDSWYIHHKDPPPRRNYSYLPPSYYTTP